MAWTHRLSDRAYFWLLLAVVAVACLACAAGAFAWFRAAGYSL